MKFYARSEPWADSFDIFIAQESVDGRRNFVNVKLEVGDEIKPNFIAPGSSIRLTGEEATMLFNALWEAGLRPHGGYGGTAQVEAIKYHLDDMRKLVFKEKP
ncbi:MAG: hypothetical protein AAB864_01645 [Patescibacteria group bacterium]